MAIATQLPAIVTRLAVSAGGAVAIQLATVAPAIAVVRANVAAVAAQVAAVAAEIATIRADVARVATHLTRSLGCHGRLRARDRRSSCGKRQRHSECHQFVAKHREILQGSVGARLPRRAVRGGRRQLENSVKGLPLLAFRGKYGIVPRRAGPTTLRMARTLRFKGLRTYRGRSDSFADSE
jgi:hypothetical protein